MKPNERDLTLVWDMLEATRELVGFTAGMSRSDFASRRMARLAVERLLQVIGEAASKTSIELRQRHGELNWADIIKMRHILSHEYGEELLRRVHRAAFVKAPTYIPLLEAIFKEMTDQEQP